MKVKEIIKEIEKVEQNVPNFIKEIKTKISELESLDFDKQEDLKKALEIESGIIKSLSENVVEFLQMINVSKTCNNAINILDGIPSLLYPRGYDKDDIIDGIDTAKDSIKNIKKQVKAVLVNDVIPETENIIQKL